MYACTGRCNGVWRQEVRRGTAGGQYHHSLSLFVVQFLLPNFISSTSDSRDLHRYSLLPLTPVRGWQVTEDDHLWKYLAQFAYITIFLTVQPSPPRAGSLDRRKGFETLKRMKRMRNACLLSGRAGDEHAAYPTTTKVCVFFFSSVPPLHLSNLFLSTTTTTTTTTDHAQHQIKLCMSMCIWLLVHTHTPHARGWQFNVCINSYQKIPRNSSLVYVAASRGRVASSGQAISIGFLPTVPSRRVVLSQCHITVVVATLAYPLYYYYYYYSQNSHRRLFLLVCGGMYVSFMDDGVTNRNRRREEPEIRTSLKADLQHFW